MAWAYDAHGHDQAMLKRPTTGTMRWKKGTGPGCGKRPDILQFWGEVVAKYISF